MKQSILAIIALGVMVVAPLNSFEKNFYPSDEQLFQDANCYYFSETNMLPIDKNPIIGSNNSKIIPKIGGTYTLEIKAGHPYNVCHGYGEWCFNFVGTAYPYPCHISCWGEGSECTHTFCLTIGFMPINEDHTPTYEGIINTTIDGFNENVLAMPARSVLVNGEFGKYINIPRQTVFIAGTPNFEYAVKGITFTDLPAYDNQ